MIEVVVDTSLHMPDMFTIKLRDMRLNWADDSSLDIGKEVEIALKGEGESQQVTLITGEITSLEPDFDAVGMCTFLIRGYDKSHRLHRGKKTRTFLKMKDSDLASKFAGEAGLSAVVDTTSVTYDWILQNDQTNMELLLSRAERIGYQVATGEGKLYFKQGTATLATGPELVYCQNLLRFSPSFRAVHQADTVKVLAWDALQKKQIVGQATASTALNQGGNTQTGGAKAKSAFGGSAEAVVVDHPVATADEAKAIAQGLEQDITREYVQAEGVCEFHAGVRAGNTVTIKNVGSRFSGKYFVTASTHRLTADYCATTFTICGRHPDTVSHLVNGGTSNGVHRDVMPGVVPAMVTNLKDPDDLGRVKVKYAYLGEIESDWVRIAVPMAGAQRGFYYLPEVNDEVLIAFEHGDVHRPYIVGALWSKTDKPPIAQSEAVGGDGKIKQRVIKSTSGHIVILDDTKGAEMVTIRDKTGKNEIIIDSAKNSMTINVEGDFAVNAKGKVTINSTQDMTLDSKAKGTINSVQDMTVNSKGKANIKAMTGMDLNGTGPTTLKGATIEVNGTGQTAVKGGAMVQIQAALVKIN
ncbi:MAG: VgrG-related protein [Chloroflexi bacterium]|nr:VgrG-related protein [Chloroflexota bacterium]